MREAAAFQKLGFVREGVIREVRFRRNHFADHIVYGILASEWAR
ncbi:MAG TPA: GNAT family protein [Pyrinomonadaceae bacterium]|nr:GNAT family protein [Pyrinomonadaceae bacterium]